MSDDIVDVDGISEPPPPEEAPPLAAWPPWTLAQIGGMTFLGGPLVGLWMHGSNLGAFGQPEQVNRWRLAAVGATAVVAVLAMVLPEGFPNSVLPMAYTVGIAQLAKQAYGDRLEALKIEGGATRGWGGAVLFGLGGQVLTLGSLFALFFVTGPGEYEEGGVVVTYAEGATEEDAQALVGALRSLDYPVDDIEASIDLTTSGETLDVCFVVQSGAWREEGTTEAFRFYDAVLEERMSRPVDVHLCDWMFERKWSAE